MEALTIILESEKGQKKWRLPPRNGLYTVGRSPKCHIHHGIFPENIWFGVEYYKGQWYLLNLSGNFMPEIQTILVEHHILFFDHFYLKFIVHRAPKLLSGETNYMNEQTETASLDPSTNVLVITKSNHKIVQTQFMDLELFKKLFPQAQNPEINVWQKSLHPEKKELEIYYKKVFIPPQIRKIRRITWGAEDFITLFSIALTIAATVLLSSYPILKDANIAQTKILEPEAIVDLSELNEENPVDVADLLLPNLEQSKQKHSKSQSPNSLTNRITNLSAKLSEKLAQTRDINDKSLTAISTASSLKLLASNKIQTGEPFYHTQKQDPNRMTASLAKSHTLTSQGLKNALAQQVKMIKEHMLVSGTGLEPEAIAAVIKSHLGQIIFCYEKALLIEPNLEGKITVKFSISASGSVSKSQIVEKTLSNENLESCVLKTLSSWKFPKPEGVEEVLVTYPFVFKSLKM